MKDLSCHIENISIAETPEEAFEVYANIMRYYGYDRAVYSLITDHPSLNLPKQHGLVTNYPEDWMKHYVSSDYIDYDPVIAQIKKTRSSFYWNDLMAQENHAEITVRLMLEANEARLCDGIGIGFYDSAGEVTGIGLCRSDNGHAEQPDYTFLACVQFLSSYFHETYREMMSQDRKIKLSPREIEILNWAAEGKTDDTIADILIISSNTVRFHWKNIFNKLNAHGRVYAITKALRLNLVTPNLITPPYQK